MEPFPHVEHGLEADLKFPELLGPGIETEDITPTIGTQVTGIQLSSLTDAGKAQLAALTAQRKVLVFRDQDFADLPIIDALKYGEYFGRHHVSSVFASTHVQASRLLEAAINRLSPSSYPRNNIA